MTYTIRCNGHVLGTSALDFTQVVDGHLSGWLNPAADALDLLDAVAIGYASVRAWTLRGTVHPNVNPYQQPGYVLSAECQAISAAVAVRLHLVLAVHHADGAEVPTCETVVQDMHVWPTLWRHQETEGGAVSGGVNDLEEDPCEWLDPAQRAQLEAHVAHDYEMWESMHADRLPDGDQGDTDDEDVSWLARVDAIASTDEPSRFQAHVRLANRIDLASRLTPLALEAK